MHQSSVAQSMGMAQSWGGGGGGGWWALLCTLVVRNPLISLEGCLGAYQKMLTNHIPNCWLWTSQGACLSLA